MGHANAGVLDWATLERGPSNERLYNQKHHNSKHKADHQLNNRAEHTAHAFASFVALLLPCT